MLMDNAKGADAYERPLLSSLSFTQATQMAPDHSPTPCSHQKRSHKAGRPILARYLASTSRAKMASTAMPIFMSVKLSPTPMACR